MPGQTYGYRWFVDQPLRTVFFHDHQYANLHQQKGLFAALNVEPKDATWHDPKTGAGDRRHRAPWRTSARPRGPDFREFSVFHQDRAPMWRADGRPVDPPGDARRLRRRPGRPGASTTATSRSRSAPRRAPRARRAIPPTCSPPRSTATRRRPCSAPTTKDPMVVRNVVGSHEEVHSFNVHGHRWLSEPDNPNSAPADTQTLSLAEFANYEFSGSGLVSLGPHAEGDARLGHERLGERHPEPDPGRREPAGRLPVRLDDRSTASGSACGASSACRTAASPTSSRCPTRPRR